MEELKRPKKEDYDFNDNIEGVRYAKDMNDYADKLEEQLRLYVVSDAKRTLAIKFADALLMDFEMSEFEDGKLCWQLCGIPQKMKTNEVYDRYIDEILANDC